MYIIKKKNWTQPLNFHKNKEGQFFFVCKKEEKTRENKRANK